MCCAAGYSVSWPLVRAPLGQAQLAPFVRVINELNQRCQMVQGQTKDPKNPANSGRSTDPAQHFRSLVQVRPSEAPPQPQLQPAQLHGACHMRCARVPNSCGPIGAHCSSCARLSGGEGGSRDRICGHTVGIVYWEFR